MRKIVFTVQTIDEIARTLSPIAICRGKRGTEGDWNG